MVSFFSVQCLGVDLVRDVSEAPHETDFAARQVFSYIVVYFVSGWSSCNNLSQLTVHNIVSHQLVVTR